MDQNSAFQYRSELIEGSRPAGLSGFMRIKNGEDWLKESVESHLPYFNEIVAVYNGCTDRTEETLLDLKSRFPEKIKIVHYEPEVYPVGSELHKSVPADSLHSVANYYNYALSQTKYRVVTKLDDDHLAISPVWEKMIDKMREVDYKLGNEMWCFSGLNLVMSGNELKIHSKVPFAGNGDHWFYELAKGRDFTKDRRFERFKKRGMKLVYNGEIAYWHLKYLKKGFGFSNYNLEGNPNSRYHKQLDRFKSGKEGITLEELEKRCQKKVAEISVIEKLITKLLQKKWLKFQREERFCSSDLSPYFKQVENIIKKS